MTHTCPNWDQSGGLPLKTPSDILSRFGYCIALFPVLYKTGYLTNWDPLDIELRRYPSPDLRSLILRIVVYFLKEIKARPKIKFGKGIRGHRQYILMWRCRRVLFYRNYTACLLGIYLMIYGANCLEGDCGDLSHHGRDILISVIWSKSHKNGLTAQNGSKYKWMHGGSHYSTHSMHLLWDSDRKWNCSKKSTFGLKLHRR